MTTETILAIGAGIAGIAFEPILHRLRRRDQRIAESAAYDVGFVHGRESYRAGRPAPESVGDLVVFDPSLPRERRQQCARYALLSVADAGEHDGWWDQARADLGPDGVEPDLKTVTR